MFALPDPPGNVPEDECLSALNAQAVCLNNGLSGASFQCREPGVVLYRISVVKTTSS